MRQNRATLKLIKVVNIPATRAETIHEFEDICENMRVSQSSVVVSLITQWVKANRRYLPKDKQKELTV